MLVLRFSLTNFNLKESGLVLAVGAVEAAEALARAVAVVAQTAAGAIAARLVSVSVKGIIARRTLLQLTSSACNNKCLEEEKVRIRRG